MKVGIFRLISVDPNGIGNKENGFLDLLYSYLLWKNGLDYYRFISVNQIGQDQGIEEFVEIETGLVNINIIFRVGDDFDVLDDAKKNEIRLEVVHAGLLLLGNEDRRFSKEILEKIKNEVLEKAFNFELESQIKKSPYDERKFCRFLIKPQTKYFDYYFLVQEAENTLCKILIYKSKPTTDDIESFFSIITWNNNNQITIEGKENQMRLVVDVSNCKVDFQNLTQYPKPPLWEMGKAETSEDKKMNAYENWLDSLPPAFSEIIRESKN